MFRGFVGGSVGWELRREGERERVSEWVVV